jgi:mono/diheme cytochrome c family protein
MPQTPWKSDDDIIKAMAYILNKSEPFNWKYGEFSGGDVARGQELFNSIGCMACHAIGGKGGDAAPALDRIAEKTSGKWIYNWILEPKNWSTHARMPSLRLSGEEARHLTAFLLTHGEKPATDEKLRAALQDEENIKAGFKVINTQGCYGCHNIKGFENASKLSVDLTEFGRKDVHELAFGDAKVPETWEAWTEGKLKDPQMFADERSTSVMPKPNITDEQRHALLVFLKGQKPEDLPEQFIAYNPDVEKGRRLVNWYNCKQCHVIEGDGGKVSEWVEDPNFLPPNLASTGARLQTHWMYRFLKNPASYPPIRSWLKLRMPTFQFTDEETDALVKYFKTIDGVDTLLEDDVSGKITPKELEAARLLIGNENFACASCHIINNDYPAAGPSVWAPDLAYGQNRLRPQWINKWIRNPAELVPGIRMPGYYPEPGSGPKGILEGDDEKQIQAIVNYLMYLGNGGSVTVSVDPQEKKE